MKRQTSQITIKNIKKNRMIKEGRRVRVGKPWQKNMERAERDKAVKAWEGDKGEQEGRNVQRKKIWNFWRLPWRRGKKEQPLPSPSFPVRAISCRPHFKDSWNMLDHAIPSTDHPVEPIRTFWNSDFHGLSARKLETSSALTRESSRWVSSWLLVCSSERILEGLGDSRKWCRSWFRQCYDVSRIC